MMWPNTASALRRRRGPVTWLRDHPFAGDLLLALLITTIGLVFHLNDSFDEVSEIELLDPTWWTALIIVASTFPILLRRRFPIPVLLIVTSVQIPSTLVGIEGSGFLGVLVALYSVGAHSSGRRRTQALIAATAAISILFVAGLIVDELPIGGFISSVVILVTGFVLGDNLRRRREAATALQDRLDRAERERELVAEQHVTAERTRIARELHDVVAHSVSVMVIQAAAARRNLDNAPEVAEEALANIETTGRQTMNELRGILGVLRRTAATTNSPDLGPQPTLHNVASLVDSSPDLPISFESSGDFDDVANLAHITGYRIVQESLTNVRRHGGPVSRVEVRIARHGAHVEISIVDDGRGAAADTDDDVDSGYGIVGMKERVRAIGGTLDAGPRAGGGWQVRAALPVSLAAPSDSTQAEAVAPSFDADQRAPSGAAERVTS